MVRRSLVLLVVLLALACAGDVAPPSTPGRTSVPVVEVTDGDTIRVDLDGRATPVRLIGIDTPERDGPYTSLECYGEDASRFTHDALDGRTVELEFDVERTDRYGRTLAYVWLDGALFNERLVRSGYAVVTTFPPNVRYVERFTAAQRHARGEQRGLWGACGSS
jgi:micrococcal nuclease